MLCGLGVGQAPKSLPGVYAAKEREALERFRVQLRARPAVLGRLPLVHKLLHHSLAWWALHNCPNMTAYATGRMMSTILLCLRVGSETEARLCYWRKAEKRCRPDSFACLPKECVLRAGRTRCQR